MNEAQARIREEVVQALPRLRRFARALARDDQDADDLLQLAMERALKRADQWQPGSSVLNWLYGIVRNAWIDELRSRKRRSAVFVELEAANDVGEAPMDRAVQQWAISDALEQLPTDQRLAVALVMVEGVAYKDAAAQLGVPIGTVTSRLARARDALQKLLRRGEVTE